MLYFTAARPLVAIEGVLSTGRGGLERGSIARDDRLWTLGQERLRNSRGIRSCC